jgi:hypothetical protein
MEFANHILYFILKYFLYSLMVIKFQPNILLLHDTLVINNYILNKLNSTYHMCNLVTNHTYARKCE